MSTTDLAFSEGEFRSRLEAVRDQMRRIGVDVAVIDQVETMTWLTGFGIGETLWRCCVVTLDHAPFLIIRRLDRVPAVETTWLKEIVGFRDWDDPHQILVSELTKRGLAEKAIGIEFESQSMSAARFQSLQILLPKVKFVDFGSIFWDLRSIKTEGELSYLRKAAQICDAAFLKTLEAVRIGGSQRELIISASNCFLKMGADTGPIGIITTGSSWDALHGNEHNAPIERDTIVHVELCPRVNGYSARIMRSIVVGKPTGRQTQVANDLIEIQDRQLATIKPGTNARQIDAIARDAILAKRLRSTYDNITGYTLGCFPSTTQKVSEFAHCFTPNSDWLIREGMTLHMYVSAEGLAFSESIVVRADGVERLTRSERKIYEAAV